VVQYRGEGVGRSTAWFAAAALTDRLDPFRAFSAPRPRPTVSVRLLAQHARSARRLRGIRVRLAGSGAGLALVRVLDRRGRVLARGVEPLYRRGSSRVRVPITRAGLRRLDRGHVRVTARFRDALGVHAGAHGAGRLR
jgi:hypothetical protein